MGAIIDAKADGGSLKKPEDNYKVLFGGATISRKEARRVFIALLFGVLAICLIGLPLGLSDKGGLFELSLAFAAIGYFVVAKPKE